MVELTLVTAMARVILLFCHKVQRTASCLPGPEPGACAQPHRQSQRAFLPELRHTNSTTATTTTTKERSCQFMQGT